MPGETQNQQPVTPINYFGLKYDGISDPTIHANQKPNQQITLLSAEDNWKKFGQQGIASGKWKDQNDYQQKYNAVAESYTNFKKAQAVHRQAKQASEVLVLKQGETVDYSKKFSPYVAPVKYAGSGTMISGKGEIIKTGTDQQIAFDKGYAIDDNTGKKVPIQDGWTTDTRYIKPGEDGSPELHIGSIADELKSGQAVSWFGPESMHSSWMSQFGNGLLGAVTDIPGYAGGLVRMAGDGATAVMNAFMGKGFKSDSDLADKWNQPAYDKFANMLRNISTGAKNQSQDYDNSLTYQLSNMVSMIGGIALTGGAAGAADVALGLGEESGIALSKAATSTAMAGMVAEPFLKECNDAGIPAGKAAIMAMGVVAATSFVTHKIGTDAVFNSFAKMQADGVLKKSIQDGIASEMKAAGISDINKVPDSGWKKIVSNIVGTLASKSEGSVGSTIGNTFRATVKGGLSMADFTLTQNAAKTALDELEKSRHENAQQGEGLFYKRDSSPISNLTEGVGSSFLMGMAGTGLFSAFEHAALERGNKGANAELRNRYMEKEIAAGNYNDVVRLIQKESKKGTWGLTDIGEDGQAIKQGEQKKSMNDINTEMLLKQASLIKEIYDKHVGEDPKFVKEKLGNDKQLQLEMIRNIGAGKRNTIELESVRKQLEDKKSENPKYDGKEEEKRIKELEDNKEKIQADYDDLAGGPDGKPGKRYSRMYNSFELAKAGLPDVSDGMQDKLIPNLKSARIQEALERSKLNVDISESRIKAQTFISELPKGDYDLSKAPMMQSDLDASMQVVKDNGIKNTKALSELHDFVKGQLEKIPEEDDERYLDDPAGYRELKQKLTAYNSTLEGEESRTERNAEPDMDKFNENWLLNKNNPSGLETENRINELYKKATSGTQADKQDLSNKKVTDDISKLTNDLHEIRQKAAAFDVYRNIPSGHSGLEPDENISQKATDAVNGKLTDLSRKLSDVIEVSGKSLLDKQVAQIKLAHENLNFNHVQLQKLFSAKEVIKFTKTEEKALQDADAALNKSVNKDGTYNETELNNVEKNHAIIDSFIHKKLVKDESNSLWKKMVSLLLGKDKRMTGYLENLGFTNIDQIEDPGKYKDDAARTPTMELDARHDFDKEIYKIKTVLNYLERVRNIDSADGYNAIKNVLKSSWGKEIYPSFEQTNILQALGFCLNPDNGFINDYNKERGAEDNTYLNNGISLIGAAGVGKNSMVLPLLFKSFKELVKDDTANLKTTRTPDEVKRVQDTVLKRDIQPLIDIQKLVKTDNVGEAIDELIDLSIQAVDLKNYEEADRINKLIEHLNVSHDENTMKTSSLSGELSDAKKNYDNIPSQKIRRASNNERKDALKGDILVIGPTNEHCDELEKAKRSAEPEGRVRRLLFSELDNMSEKELHDKIFKNRHEFVVGDEMTGLSQHLMNKLISLVNGGNDNKFEIANKKARCLFLLDPYQSGPFEGNNAEPAILRNTQVSEPYRINYRTGSRDIQLLGESFKRRVNGQGKYNVLPISHCNEERTLGTEYVKTPVELFDKFKESFGKGEKPWLIVKDHAEAVKARKRLAELPESVSANILTISMLEHVDKPEYFTAQGKQNPKIYLLMEEPGFRDYQTAGNNIYARFMYTGITRAGGGSDNTKGYCCAYIPEGGVNGERLKANEGEADRVEVDKNKLFERLDTITSAFPEAGKGAPDTKTGRGDTTGVTEEFQHAQPKPGDSKPEDVPWETRTGKLFTSKGILTTTSHEDSMPGCIDVANKMASPGSDKQYALLKHEGKKNVKGKDYEVIRAYSNDGKDLGALYERGLKDKGVALNILRKNIIEKGPQSVSITNIDPGQLKRVSSDGTKSIPVHKFFEDNKHVEKGSVFMRTDPKTEKPYLSVNIRPKGWKGAPVELAVFTPNLDAQSIDNINDFIKSIDAKSLFDFNKENPEILGTIDFNQSVIRKIITQEAKDKKENGITKYFMPLTEDGRVYLNDKSPEGNNEGENGKVSNLKSFYNYLSKNEDAARQLYLFQGLDPDDRGKPGAYKINESHPNFEKLTTYHSRLGYPEMQFDWKGVNPEENKKPETDEFSGPIKKVSTSTEPTKENTDELFLPSDAQAEGINETPSEYIAENETEEEQENLKNDTALINIFGDSNIVDFVKKGIYSSIRQVINPGDIVKTGGIGSPEFKSLEQRIADYKKSLADKFATVPEDIKNKINDTSFDLQDHLGNDEYSNSVKSAYIRQMLLDDNVFDRFINKLYPGKKENYGGVKQENDVYNIDRNLGVEFKNILSSIPLLNFDKANWQQPQDSGFKLNPNTVISDIKALAEQEGWKGREEIKNNLTGYYTRFSDRTGRLEARENAMLSFCKHFFTNPDIEQTGKYSYSFIQDNKGAIQEKYPILAKDENFQKHADVVDSLMNHFYSFFDSNTLNNYHKIEYDGDGFKPISSSASSIDEIKNQFKSASDATLIQSGKNEAGEDVHSVKQPFDERYVSNILKEKNPLEFEFNKDVTDKDILNLFSKMGITLDPKVPGYFRNKKDGWDRLARIAGVFTHAVLGKNEEGLKGILSVSMRTSIGNITDKPLPSDFFDYQKELAEAQHKVTDDAYRQGDINVDGKFVQTTVLGSHVTDRFDDGGKHLIAEHQNNMVTVSEYAKKLSNSLNQVYNGKLSFDKIGKVDGITNKFGKSVKFGKDMTDLDVANFQLNAFAEAIKKSNKSQAYPIWGEYGGDGTNMRVYPVKIKDVNKLIEKGEFTKEFRDYIQNSVRDIFNINEQEFRVSKEKWAPYLKNMPDEEWSMMDHNQLENHFNELWKKASKAKKIQIATKIDNDPNFISHTDYMIKYDYDKAVQRDPETNQLIPVISLKLGHATTFNKYIDPIFNGDNYNQKDNPAFIDHFATKDMVALRDLGFKGADDNTIKAYSLLRTIALKNINPLTYGSESQYKDRENYQKYGAGRESPGMRGSFAPGQVLRSAVIPDIHSESEGFGVVNRTDGKQIINPFYEAEFNKAFGGEFGPLGKGPGKFRIKGVNPVTGIAYDYKCQTMKLNWQLLDKSSNWGIEDIVQPSADHFMLEHYMKLMLHPDLYNHFTELRNSKGTKAAIETMQEELKSHPEWHDKMVHFLSHESVVKTGIRSRNVGVTGFEGLQHDAIYARDILHQLNLDKDTDSTQTLSRQMLSSLGVMKDAEEHLKNIDEATKNKLDNIWNDINKQIGVPKDSPEFYGKFMDYLRSETKEDLNNATYNYLGAKLMTNPDISLNLGMLSNMAENKLISTLNKGMLPRIAGMSNVNDDSIYYRMRTGNDGNQYDYEDIRKMGTEEAIKLGLNDTPDEHYQTFSVDEDGAKPADIMSTYSNENRKRFGILPGENVNDVFTIHFKKELGLNPKNTANLSDEEFSKLIRFIDPLTIDYDKSPMFRETDRFSKEGLPDDKFIAQLLEPLTIDQRSVFSYRNAFSESLNGFATRVPFGGLPFGKPTRIRSFIDDYGSTQISNGNWNKMDGQDLDGDVQYTNYFQKENPDKPEISENNKILKSVLELYNNPANKDLIFHEENIKEYQPKEKSSNTRTGLENTLYNYQKNIAGKNCIALEANFSTVYKALYRASLSDPSILGKLSITPDDLDIYGKHMSNLISTVLSMALDNPKEDILGRMNINEESIKLANAILLYRHKLIEGDFLGNSIDDKLKEVGAYLILPEIASIYKEFFKSKSVGEDSKKLHDIINERIAYQSTIADNHEKAILAGTATPEDMANLDILKGSLNRLSQFKELEMLSEGLAQVGTFTSIYSKGIQSDHYKRDNMAHGAHGIEFLLNAPMDRIFNEEEYQKFTNDPLNKDWFKNRFTYAKDANNATEIERQHQIRANVNYKKFFDNSPVLKEMWKSYYNSADYITDNFMKEKPWNDFRDSYKKSVGLQGMPSSRMDYKLNREITKFCTSLFYNMNYGGSDKRVTVGDSTDWYSLGNVNGRERFSNDVIEKFKDIKNNKQYSDNQVIRMLGISSERGINRITLNGGNRIPADVMLSLQAAIRDLKDDSGIRMGDKKLSIYDMLSGYAGINDNFDSGGHSLVNLFDEKAYKNISNWMENTLMPTIKGDKKFELRDNPGNKVTKTWDELQQDFKHKMLSDPRNKDLLLSAKKSGGAEYHTKSGEVIRNGIPVGDPIENSRYGYNPNTEAIAGVNNTRSLVNEGEAPINTPHDIQAVHYRGPKEGGSHIENFLKKTAHPIIQDERLRNLAESYLNLPNVVEGLKDVKVYFADLKTPEGRKEFNINAKVSLRGLSRGKDIFIDKNEQDIAAVFIHELHHTLLHDVLKKPLSEANDNEKDFKENISNLYVHAMLEMDRGLYGLSNVDEFVSMAFSDKKFQDELMKVSSPDPWKSTWTKLVEHLSDFISKVLGIDKEQLRNTLLNDVFAATHDYLSRREDREAFKKTLTRFDEMYLVDDTPKDPILALRNTLLPNEVMGHSVVTPDAIRNSIYKGRNMDKHGNYHIYGDKENIVHIGKDAPTEAHIREIQEKMSEMSTDQKDNFVAWMNSGFSPETLEKHFPNRDDGTPYFNEKVLDTMYRLIDFSAERGDVATTMEKYAEEKGLPKEFTGNNYIVVKHSTKLNEELAPNPDLKDFIQRDKDGNPVEEISLFDFTSKGIGEHNRFDSQIWKSKASNRTEAQLRNFQMLATAMKIKEQHRNVRFKRTGLMRMMKNKIEHSFDLDMTLNGDLGSLRKFLGTPSGQKWIDSMPEEVKNLLKNPLDNKLFSAIYGQDYMYQLMKDWESSKPEQQKGFNIKEGVSAVHEFMNTNGKNAHILKEVLKNRSAKLDKMDEDMKKTRDWKRERLYVDKCLVGVENNNYSDYNSTSPIKNISKMTNYLATPGNVGNPELDYVNHKQNRANRQVVEGTLQYNGTLLSGEKESRLKKEIDDYLKRHADLQSLNMASYGVEQSSKIFDRLLQKIEAVDKDGKTYIINSKILHHDLNDKQTIKALAEGAITKEDVATGKFFADELKQHYKDHIRHTILQEDKGVGNYTDKIRLEGEVEKQYKANCHDGMVPYLPKQLGEKVMGVDLKKLAKRSMEQNVIQKDLLKDGTGNVNNYFAWQMGSHIEFGNLNVAKAMGLRIDDNGQWVIDDMKKLNDVSYNMEHILTSFKMSNLRTEKYDNDVIPAYDAVRRLADEAAVFSKKPMGEFIKYLEGQKAALVGQKTEHWGEEGSAMRYAETSLMMMKDLAGTASTSFNLALGCVLPMANSLIPTAHAIGNDIGNTGLYGTKELAKAAPKLVSEAKLLRGMGDKYGVMNMSQRDIDNHPKRRILNKTKFSSFTGHYMIYAADYGSREWIMAAQMIKDGKYDAHTLNEETGRVEYHEKMDRQIWNADGSQTADQKAIREAHRLGLIADEVEGYQKLIDDPSSPLPKGYSTSTGEQVLKDVSDQVIYDMSDNAYMNAQNSFLGKMLVQFKRFGLGQVEQAFSGPYKRRASGKMITVENEYGEKVAKWQPQDYEGGAYSLFKSLGNVKSLLKNPKEFWMDMTPKQKANLMALCADGTMFIGLWFFYNQDEIKKDKKLADIIKRGSLDLVNPYNPQFWTESFKEPVPAINFLADGVEAMYYTLTGQFDKALKKEPVGRGDVGVVEQLAGYSPPKKQAKKKV